MNGERIKANLHGNNLQFPVLKPDKVHKKLSVTCLDYLRSGGLRPENTVLQHEEDEELIYGFEEAAAFEKHDKEADGYNYQEASSAIPS